MNIEEKLLALMEGHDLQAPKSVYEGSKFIVATKHNGSGQVIVAGPYDAEDDTHEDEKSFVDHPDYSKIETKPYEQCKNCNWYFGGALHEAFEDIVPGAFHRWLGKKEDEPITDADIKKGLDSDDKHAQKMAQFAKNARKFKHLKEAKKAEDKGEKKSEKKDDKRKKPADKVDAEPAVKIENPINPELGSSDGTQKVQEKKMDYKKLCEQLVEAKKEGKVTSDWTPFNDEDWQGFAGAHPISADRQPEIMSHGDWAIVHSGIEGQPGHSEVRAMYFHSGPGEHPQHLPNSFEGQHITLASGQTPHVDKIISNHQYIAKTLTDLHGTGGPASISEDFKKFIEANKETLTENFEPFKKEDWYAWGGADKFANGDQPKIMQHGPWTVIAAGAEENRHPNNDYAEIHAYHDDMVGDDGIQDHIKVYHGPRRHAEAIMKDPALIKGILDTIHHAEHGDTRPYAGAKINLVEPHDVNKLSEKKIEEFLQQEELSEEFQLKASTLFAAKLNEAVEVKTSALQEEYRVKLEEAISASEQSLIEKIDGYSEALSEKWMQDNEVALEATIRSELTESFIEGLLGLCKQHSIDLPIEKRDAVKTLEEELQETKAKLEQVQIDLHEQTLELNEATREIVMEEMTKGMTLMDSNKFKTIMEDFDFESKQTFVSRCEVIKESFFKKPDTKKTEVTALNENLNQKPAEKKVTQIGQYANWIKSKNKQ